MNNQEIRLRILKYLYENDEEKTRDYVTRDKIISMLNMDGRKIDAAILYLEEKGYVQLIKGCGSLFNSARINSYGIDLVENESSLKQEFPLVQFIIQNGHINVANQNSNQNSITINNTCSFEQIYAEIEKLGNKDIIRKQVELIESESKKDEAKRDYTLIKKSWDFIKQNAGTIVSLLAPIIKGLFGT